jgi:hypothetical protein
MNNLDNYEKVNSGIFSKLLVFLSIVTTASSLVVITRFSNEKYFILFIAFSSIIFILFCLTNKKAKMSSDILLYTCMSSIFVLISMIVNQDFDILNFTIISLFFISFFFITMVSPKIFINYYIKVLVVLSLYSLIMTYFVPKLIPSIISFFPIGFNSGGFQVIDYGLSFQYVGLVSRNTGIFREMGVYSVYLNFALFFLMFTNNNIKHKNIAILILVITIISTLSTPGLMSMGIMMIVYLINMGIFKKRNLKLILSICIILLIMVFVFPVSLDYINDSVNKLTQKGSSLVGRTDSIVSNLKVWSEYPLFGAGYTESIRRAEALSNIDGILHNTSTTTSFLAMYGLFFTIILSAPMFFFVFVLNIRWISKILLFLSLFLLINSQRLFLDSLFYFISYIFLVILLNRKRLGGTII